MRVATYNTELARSGPGLLLRDILSKKDAQVEAVAWIIAEAQADIILLQSVDYDHDRLALRALRDRVSELGWHYPYLFALPPNTGQPTFLDVDGDGRLGRPRDAQSYGEFAGQGGMAILSRKPVLPEDVEDFSSRLWSSFPSALLLLEDGAPLLTPELAKVQRLSTVGHWVVPILVDGQELDILAFHASPPVFDGPEDRNGRRNHDEIVFWTQYLDGSFGLPPPRRFVLMGDANLDPVDAEGRKEAIHRLLDDPRLQDPRPQRRVPAEQGPGHVGDPRLDTVKWPEPIPGHLRVSYILPSQDIAVMQSGVFEPDDPNDRAAMASRHRLVWVDLQLN